MRVDRKEFIFNDWISTSKAFTGEHTEFSVVVNYPDINTFPRLHELIDAITELWTISKKDLYCPTSPFTIGNVVIDSPPEETVTFFDDKRIP